MVMMAVRRRLVVRRAGWLAGHACGTRVAATAAAAASRARPRPWRQWRAILRYSSILYRRSESEASALSFVVIQKDFLVYWRDRGKRRAYISEMR